MAKQGFFAVVYCFSKDQAAYQADGSCGVVVFGCPSSRPPNKQEVDRVCEHACEQIQIGEIEPGQIVALYKREPSAVTVINDQIFSGGARALGGWAENKFQVGLWLADAVHAPHATVQ